MSNNSARKFKSKLPIRSETVLSINSARSLGHGKSPYSNNSSMEDESKNLNLRNFGYITHRPHYDVSPRKVIDDEINLGNQEIIINSSPGLCRKDDVKTKVHSYRVAASDRFNPVIGNQKKMFEKPNRKLLKLIETRDSASQTDLQPFANDSWTQTIIDQNSDNQTEAKASGPTTKPDKKQSNCLWMLLVYAFGVCCGGFIFWLSGKAVNRFEGMLSDDIQELLDTMAGSMNSVSESLPPPSPPPTTSAPGPAPAASILPVIDFDYIIAQFSKSFGHLEFPDISWLSEYFAKSSDYFKNLLRRSRFVSLPSFFNY